MFARAIWIVFPACSIVECVALDLHSIAVSSCHLVLVIVFHLYLFFFQAMLEEFESKMSAVLQAVASLTTSMAGASSRLHKIEVECWEVNQLLGNPRAAEPDSVDDVRDSDRDLASLRDEDDS